MRRRPAAATLAPVLIVLLLAIVAIVSAGTRSGAGPQGHGPPRAFFDYVMSTLMVAWALMGIVFLYVFFRDRQLKKQQERHAWAFRGARTIVYLIIFFVVAFQVRGPLKRLRQIFTGQHDARAGKGHTPAGKEIRPPREVDFRWAPLLVTLAAGVLLLAIFVAALLRRRAGLMGSEATVEEALAQVMDDALEDIRAERDPRKAIIAAYARMEKLLAGFGRARAPSETPFEYLARVLIELRVSRAPVEALTELFERAKFSTHALGGGDKARAIEALENVRDELRDPLTVASEREPVPA